MLTFQIEENEITYVHQNGSELKSIYESIKIY